MAAVIAAPALLFAGNIPQYQVSKGDKVVSLFTNGTNIPCKWSEGEYALFPDGKEYANANVGEGFPIGFNFRFAGQYFDQFVVNNDGIIHFGNGSVSTGDNTFQVNFYPMKNGVKAGAISYRTTGTEGNRVLEVQYKDLKIRETGYVGEYHLQFRFYEEDGRIEIAFQEIETTGTDNTGFSVGLHGWDSKDALHLTALGINSNLDVKISPKLSSNILESDSYVHWDSNDYDKHYKPVYVFTPCLDTTAPESKPKDFIVTQRGNRFAINCKKAELSPATVILYSNSPFSSDDYPKDGETFRGAYYDKNDRQIITTTYGNAKALYYGNDDNIAITLDNVEDGIDYYFTAMSANGYPAYGRDNVAEVKIATSQAAPNNFTANATSESLINLAWDSNYPVIIASTTEVLPGYQKGYKGVFGIPESDAKVGDEIEGGGKVIYVGDVKNLAVDAETNTLIFFRAWSVNGNTLSATSADVAAVTNPSFPYEPGMEYYPFGEKLMGWSASEDQYVPWIKQYDQANALRAFSVSGNVVSLMTPELDLSLSTHISFEYSLETIRPADDQGVPQGNKPGVFGTGSLNVSAGGKTYKSVASYNGTMTECPDGYESGSSTFEVVELDLDAIGKNERITFSFSTDKEETSYLYLRNIKISQTEKVPQAPDFAPSNAVANEDKSANLHFSCLKAEDAEYTLVLFSEKPISENDYPRDGVVPAVGSNLGDAIVLYYGNDEDVECETNYDMVIADFGTTYYFAAFSASSNPLYNCINIAKIEYTTMKEAGKPMLEEPEFDGTNLLLTIKGTRHANAASTIVLISEDKFNGTLEDGHQYNHGDEVGNAKVVYHSTDETINQQTNLVEPNKTYTLTAISANERGWWSDSQTTHVFTTNATGIEPVGIDTLDLPNAEIYNVMGVRINVNSIEELQQGIYFINGKKTIIK